MEFSLTSQMSVAAQRHKQLPQYFLKRAGKVCLQKNSKVNVKVSNGLKMMFIKVILHSSCSVANEDVFINCLNRKGHF